MGKPVFCIVLGPTESHLTSIEHRYGTCLCGLYFSIIVNKYELILNGIGVGGGAYKLVLSLQSTALGMCLKPRINSGLAGETKR